MKNNIVLLGGSNSILVKGFQKGLKEGIEELNKKDSSNLAFHNLALGGCGSVQILLELCRNKNQEILQNASHIIIEANVNDINNLQYYLSLENVNNIMAHISEILWKLKTKIIFMILPVRNFKNILVIDNMSRHFANIYGFNVIDMHKIYEKNNAINLFFTNDDLHQLHSLMAKMGRIIIENLNNFHYAKNTIMQNEQDLPEYKVIETNDFLNFKDENIQIYSAKASKAMSEGSNNSAQNCEVSKSSQNVMGGGGGQCLQNPHP